MMDFQKARDAMAMFEDSQRAFDEANQRSAEATAIRMVAEVKSRDADEALAEADERRNETAKALREAIDELIPPHKAAAKRRR